MLNRIPGSYYLPNTGTFKKVLKTIFFSRILNTVWHGNICLFMNCSGAFVTVLRLWNIPYINYITTGYQISGRISGRFRYPVSPNPYYILKAFPHQEMPEICYFQNPLVTSWLNYIDTQICVDLRFGSRDQDGVFLSCMTSNQILSKNFSFHSNLYLILFVTKGNQFNE